MIDAMSEPTVVPLNLAAAQATKEGVAAESDPIRSAPGQISSLSVLIASTPDPGAKCQTERPQQPDPQLLDAHRPFMLKDVQLDKKDREGHPVKYIYAAQAGEYVIYKADDQVRIQFADDSAQAGKQRKALLPLNSARAEVNSLLQGLSCREIFDRQLAYALQLAFDGDVDGAKEITGAAKATVLAKRAARGRFQYLKWSYGATVLLTAVLFMASWLHPFQEASGDLWLAAKAGLVGAAFSIALAIRGRTVALDTDLLDNVTDGTLRLVIGIISAGVLLLMFKSGIVPTLKIGDADFKASSLTWEMVLVIGFLGGFLERLVPDLLEKRNVQGNGSHGPAGTGASVK
jgi:hypothetical protein